jgi:hypothetical protein
MKLVDENKNEVHCGTKTLNGKRSANVYVTTYVL